MQSHSIRLAAVSEELRSRNLKPAINIEIIIMIIMIMVIIMVKIMIVIMI